MDSQSGWGRRVIRGIANYSLKVGPWQLTFCSETTEQHRMKQLALKADGIIARIHNEELNQLLQSIERPCVNISGILLKEEPFPRVCTDYASSAQLASQHFRERGFQHIAYCGFKNRPYEQRHCKAFIDILKEQHIKAELFQMNKVKSSWAQEQKELAAWLNSLPKPIAVFCWGTQRAHELLNLCLQYEIPVPEQVAILAGDDDDLLCEVAHPPLSGVVTPAEEIGYEAARILESILHGELPPTNSSFFESKGIHTRQSTDVLAIDDINLQSALQFIRETIPRTIRVEDVVEKTSVSRRALERKFQHYLGHSPSQEIQRVRLNYAKQLLRETEMTVADVAAQSGYSSNEYMIKVFQKNEGRSPLNYRSWVKGR